MNEEQKPHKTWIMLKKAWHFANFATHWDMVPTFTSGVAGATEKQSNEYGEWTAYASKGPKYWSRNGTGHYGTSSTNTLTLPKGCSLTFTGVAAIFATGQNMTVKGLNVKTNQWETIFSRTPNSVSSMDKIGEGNARHYSISTTEWYSAIQFVFAYSSGGHGAFRLKGVTLKY